MEDKTYEKHVYDLDLKQILKNYEKGMSQVKLDPGGQSAQYFSNLVKFHIDEYCRFKKIEFDEEIQILITPDDVESYQCFLSLSLTFLEIHKIRQYLRYHEKRYNSIGKSGERFLKVIEFTIADFVKNASPFDNSQRLNEMMRWVEDKTDPARYSQKNKTKIPPPAFEHKLLWDRTKLSALSSISKELCNKQYTERKKDFSDVFHSHKTINWLGSIESWVYMIAALSNTPYNCISTTKSRKSYFTVGRKFFKICNGSKKLDEKLNCSTMIININKRSREKHRDTRAGIDFILKFVFDK